jgi:DNA-binding CsgD family transcriptional regulator
MSHCRSSFLRLCTRRAQLCGIDVTSLMSEHSVAESLLADREQRLPWGFLTALLDRLQEGLGGPLALEQFGAEIAAAHPLFRLLGSLHFGLAEIQQIAAERVVPHLFDGLVQPLVCRQSDGAMRITLSLGRESLTSYAFWTLMLGIWRPLSRLFELGDSVVEVEMADRFAEFLVIFPVDTTGEPALGQEIRRRVKESLLKDLVRYEELLELPNPDPRTSILERRIGAVALPNARPIPGLAELEADIRQKLKVERVQLFEMTHAGLRRISLVGGVLEQARIRRVFWLGGAAVGAIEIERPGEAGHAREASLLDEHIDGFAYRFADILHRLPFGMTGGGFASAEPEVRDPAGIEPPPSSRGRVARAARDGRLRELTEQWQLSDRQRSVLALLVDGLGNREIAIRLSCSIGTIENHVTKLLKRAAVDNRAALTATFWKTQQR